MDRRNLRVRKANPVEMSGLMSAIVSELSCEKEFYFERLKKNWKHILGETNARNIQPLSLDNAILTASVSSPGWLTEFQFAKKKLLEKINQYEKCDGITICDIRFVLNKYLQE